jgi:hypothetical protein
MSQARPATVTVVRVAAARPAGHVLTPADLDRFELADVGERTTRSIVSWTDLKDLPGMTLERALPANSVLFWSDVRVGPERLPLGPGEDAIFVSLEGVDHDIKRLHVGDKVTFEVAEHETGLKSKPGSLPLKIGPLRIVAVAPTGSSDTVMVAIPSNPAEDPTGPLRRATARGSGGMRLCGLIVHQAAESGREGGATR